MNIQPGDIVTIRAPFSGKEFQAQVVRLSPDGIHMEVSRTGRVWMTRRSRVVKVEKAQEATP